MEGIKRTSPNRGENLCQYSNEELGRRITNGQGCHGNVARPFGMWMGVDIGAIANRASLPWLVGVRMRGMMSSFTYGSNLYALS